MRQKKDKDAEGMLFADDEIPPDPRGEEPDAFDQADVDATARKILRYVKERSADNHLVYRKELEMITQDMDEVIDEAIKKLKHDREINELDKNEFRLAGYLKPLKEIEAEDREVKHTKEKQNKVKVMREKSDLDKFERNEDNEDSGNDVYDLTDDDVSTQMFDGERIDMEDVLGEPIVIRDMVTRPSSFSEGDYAILQIEMGGELRVVLTGSKVLVKQVSEKADRMPFRCKVIEQQSTKSKYKYYTLAPATKSKELPFN